MELIFKEGSLTYRKAFKDDASAEEVLIGVYELIAKVYSQQSVINAYYNTDPDTMDVRNE
jgi:hypothetical protein